MERELLADIGARRLLPSMSLHEFEAIAFVSPTTVAEVVEGQGSPAAGDLEAIAEVGVTHSTVFNRFGSKEALMLWIEVYRPWCGQISR